MNKMTTYNQDIPDAVALYQRSLRYSRKDRLPADYPLPQPPSVWPPENVALLHEYHAWLIADNAGLNGAVWVQRIEEAEGPMGLNAATGEMVDLIAAGVIDPAKVTRAALQNAASIAALLLTTEVLVVDKPEPEGSGGMGGGMDGMGGMGGMM